MKRINVKIVLFSCNCVMICSNEFTLINSLVMLICGVLLWKAVGYCEGSYVKLVDDSEGVEEGWQVCKDHKALMKYAVYSRI